jgi:hypothetical protein
MIVVKADDLCTGFPISWLHTRHYGRNNARLSTVTPDAIEAERRTGYLPQGSHRVADERFGTGSRTLIASLFPWPLMIIAYFKKSLHTLSHE